MRPHLTTTEAARILGISRRRVLYLIARGQLDADKIGPGRRGVWVIGAASVQKRLAVQQAQRVWSRLGIPLHLWGARWATETEPTDCPRCGAAAYAVPPGVPVYAGRAGCSACEAIL